MVIVEQEYLGSEAAFVRGLKAAQSAERYLLLDQDAELESSTLEVMLELSVRDPEAGILQIRTGTVRDGRHMQGPRRQRRIRGSYVSRAPRGRDC